jgi:hypothetical protein
MNARTNIQKTKGLFIALIASLTFVGCGSFQGASYFSSDGIYTTKTQVRTERTVRPQRTNSNNSSYYSEYFKDAAAGTVAENEVFFTDTENYTSEQNYTDENNYVESSQIPWGGQTSQTEVVIIDRSPNFMWGLSGFAFRASPFWNGYYYNDPFRFGYGGFVTPFMNPYYGYGGFAGAWGYDPFYSPFNYYPGFAFGYGWGGWNRWNRWNRWGGHGYGHHGHLGGNDYASTVARVKSGRGEKNYEGSRRTNSRVQERNAKTQNQDVNRPSLSRLNVGRGINSLGKTYMLTNRKDNISPDSKLSGRSNTKRPVYGSSNSISSNLNRTASTNSPKGVQRSSRGRFTQSRYGQVNRTRINTTSPRRTNRPAVNRSSQMPKRTSIQSPRRVNRNNSFNNNNSSRRTYKSTPSSSYRSSSPSRSYNSGSSRSSSSSRGRSSSGGRRNP